MQINDVKTRGKSATTAVANDEKNVSNDDSGEVASSSSFKTRRSKRINSGSLEEEKEDEENKHSFSAIKKKHIKPPTLAEVAAKAALEADSVSVAAAAASFTSPSTLTTKSLSPNSSSSTPRKKRIDTTLANLHSNLSPKYIGFATPPLTTDSASTVFNSTERTRSSRRRQLNSTSNEYFSSTPSPPNEIFSSCIRRTTVSPETMTAPLRQKQSSFVSPIDKLLIKNGSTSPSAAIFDPLTSTTTATVTKNIKMHASPLSFGPRKTRSQLSAQIATIAALTLPEPIDLESIIPSVLVNQHPSSHEEQQQQEDKNEPDLSTEPQTLSGEIINSEKDEVFLEVTETHNAEVDPPEEEPENLLFFKYDEDHTTEEEEEETAENFAEEVIKEKDLIPKDKTTNVEDLLLSSSAVEEVATSKKEEEIPTLQNEVDTQVEKETEAMTAIEYTQEKVDVLEIQNEKAVAIENTPIIVIDDDDDDDNKNEEDQKQSPDPQALLHVDDAATNNTLAAVPPAAKSPSAFSTDSAKGSSVNDAAWMFTTGDLFWGQIYSYCYWPCMVCPDPDGKTIKMEATTSRSDPTNQHLVVHVRFFADNARRNWVKRENLLPFLGLESYEAHIAQVKKNYGKKSTKYKQLMPQKGRQFTWQEAVKEANIVAEVQHADRVEKFYEIYEKSKAFIKDQRKRRQSMIFTLITSSASELGSLYDSTDNLFPKQQLQSDSLTSATTIDSSTTSKRDRSLSPYSPAYSPVKVFTPGTTKRRKLSNNNSNNSNESYLSRTPTRQRQQQESDGYDSELLPASQTSTTTSPQEAELFLNGNFKKFYFAMKDFVMAENNDEKMERSLFVAVRNIWSLKEINQNQLHRKLEDVYQSDMGSSLVENNGTGRGRPTENAGSLKRLSNRLKTISLRRSLPEAAPNSKIVEIVAEPTPRTKTPKNPINRPIEEVINDIFNLDNKYLFKGFGRDPVCKYCHKFDDKLMRCGKGACQSWLHADCIGTSLNDPKNGVKRSVRLSKTVANDNNIPIEEPTTLTSTPPTITHITADEEDSPGGETKTEEIIVCTECVQNKAATCTVCGSSEKLTVEEKEQELVFCSMPQCGKAYHPSCCKYWPQAKITKSKNIIESFRCPSHVCHTCVSDDPKGKFQHLSNAKLTKCVRCPATYHTDSTCIPAGSEIITASHIICPRHNSATVRSSDAHINVSWCFICVGGGQLVCCETCPTAVHATCLNIPINPDAGYICEECESGRMPLYGEMVWAKFKTFRWWPAVILPPTEVPQNIMRKIHNPLEFVVRFFGTHDHGWISRRRVYLYVEGDSSEPPKSKSYLDLSYNRGVEEAKQIYQIIKLKKQTQSLTNESKEKLHPQPYVRIKANRAVSPVRLLIDMEKVNKCECAADDYEPCGPDSNCLNRVLYHECNPKLCPAGERCQNQMFESRISPRLDVVYMKERGFGLVCREFIPAGAFVIEYVGEIINDDEFRQRMQQKSNDRDENFYFLSVEKDYIIDAGPKGNMARFMNHSCDPNCETQKWSVNGLNRVGLFAIKDIAENNELTFNYHWDELLGSKKKTCYCGAANCAGQIGDKVVKSNSEVHSKTKGRPPLKVKKPVKRLKKKEPQQNSKNKHLQIKINNFKSAQSATTVQTKTKKHKEGGSDDMNSNEEIDKN